MTIKDMHYDFKRKVNKIDSNQNRNFLIPEIDLTLNEAQELFVKWIAEPRLKNHLGFETSQRSTDDIRNIVMNDISCTVENDIIELPDDYQYYLRGRAIMSKGNCKNVKGILYIKRHNDEFDNSEFDKSSFEWRSLNGVFTSDGIKLYPEDIEVNEIILSYIKKLRFIHNAEDFVNGTYNKPDGTPLTGSVDCELPEQVHSEIVDIAALLATGNINSPEYQLKMTKLSLNELK